MEVVALTTELRESVRTARARGMTVGIVPTMGALHEGHLSLVRRARAECGQVVVTSFVNPAQFGEGEDLSRYPRDAAGDQTRAADAGADLLFAPPVSEVYPDGFRTWVTVEALTSGLCGLARPTHFRGVTTVIARLFNLVGPDRAYFGEKDYQQLQVIRRMTRDLGFPVEIIACPIVREPDGLAMSSRNRYLSASGRKAALALNRGLRAARDLFARGERSSERIAGAALAVLDAEREVRTDYASVVDADDLAAMEHIDRPALLAIAAHVEGTRLIDNIVLIP